MILLADSGSTKTDWRLVDDSGRVVSVQTDGLNPYYQTTDELTITLQTQLMPQLGDATIDEVFFYGAGCTGPAVNPRVAEALQTMLPGLQRVEVSSDMLGAARGAIGYASGIACILGTGANACCYEHGQITRGIQSLGFWLGDEGSGGYLGKTLVRDFFQERLPPNLREAFQTRYTLDRATLLDNAYNKPFPNRYFASFTPFLSDNLAHPYIAERVENAFVLFLTTYVSRFPEAAAWPVHFVGSIAYYFAQPLQNALKQTGLTAGSILKAPIDGLVEYHKKG